MSGPEFEWIDDWPQSPVQATEVVEAKEELERAPVVVSERRSLSAKKQIAGALALTGATLGGILAFGFIRGNNVEPGPEVGPAMGKIVRPEVVRIARKVLQVEGAGGRRIISHPSQIGGGGETVKLASYFNNERIDISVTMDRGESGDLDATTAYDAEVDISSCDEKFCGGKENNYQVVDMFSGDETTFTHGGWGVEDYVMPPGYEQATIDIQTTLDGPGESSETKQAKTAIKEAKIWTRYADVYLDEALRGQIEIPKEPAKQSGGTVV